mmetsp:Transcript_13675/g.43238  ORF Transcript_13675/g.43238 Transcript_13675/m.43238 type:complete len:285 (-) Transcript_13675:106-960(-)|eukprot:CAMPEP_0204527634 /NCGR_PEP_ID=MMETSP0661-20131031/9090_1 /ASSEMBLY_ACC=CAM_ASM_000606 /TAXON_ID=109239 /ORGANISM="Alexandrium margalefi, Strain AMGDE01CS-322" /LENGTH=284 /DNA_ID=CAMNT_0051533563 /DNA_START=83 /DNA_END=937 /DNA_ORIENTATION=+
MAVLTLRTFLAAAIAALAAGQAADPSSEAGQCPDEVGKAAAAQRARKPARGQSLVQLGATSFSAVRALIEDGHGSHEDAATGPAAEFEKEISRKAGPSAADDPKTLGYERGLLNRVAELAEATLTPEQRKRVDDTDARAKSLRSSELAGARAAGGHAAQLEQREGARGASSHPNPDDYEQRLFNRVAELADAQMTPEQRKRVDEADARARSLSSSEVAGARAAGGRSAQLEQRVRARGSASRPNPDDYEQRLVNRVAELADAEMTPEQRKKADEKQAQARALAS